MLQDSDGTNVEKYFRSGKVLWPEASFDFEPQPQTVSGQVTLRFTMTSPTLEG